MSAPLLTTYRNPPAAFILMPGQQPVPVPFNSSKQVWSGVCFNGARNVMINRI